MFLSKCYITLTVIIISMSLSSCQELAYTPDESFVTYIINQDDFTASSMADSFNTSIAPNSHVASVTGDDENGTITFVCESGYYISPQAEGASYTISSSIQDGLDFSDSNSIRIVSTNGNWVIPTQIPYQNNVQNIRTSVVCAPLAS